MDSEPGPDGSSRNDCGTKIQRLWHQNTMAPKRSSSAISADALSESRAKAELKRLATEIAGHDKRYYQDDAPTVSDAEYDALRRRYLAIEARFPHLRTPESLTQRVGAAPSA